MGRRLRLHFPGACYHVIVRGNNRERLFVEDQDRLGFLALMAEGVQRFGHEVHAYCLMPNHVHLAIQVGTISLSKIVHNLSFRFARRMNKRLGRSGHFFERRYRAGLVQTDRSLLNVVRYVHRNPVEAGLVADPDAYRWSSHGAYMGREAPSWLTTELILRLCARDRQEARAELMRLVGGEPRSDEAPWSPERLISDDEPTPASPPPLAGRLDSSVEEILVAVTQVTGVTLRELEGSSRRHSVTKARALAAVIVRDHSDLSLRPLAGLLRRSPSTLSYLASRVESLAPSDRLREELRACLGVLALR